MASGCILGDCPVCDELVWEDQWSGTTYERTYKFVHMGKCADIFKSKGKLLLENDQLRKELAEYKKFYG